MKSGKIYRGDFKYKYVPYGDGARAIIRDATIKFSSPTGLNDPFDCAPRYTVSNLHDLFRKFPKAFHGTKLSPGQRILYKRRMEILLGNTFAVPTVFQKSINQRASICSMTSNPVNPLMWAHYAQNHTGVVLEFSNNTPSDTNNLDLIISHLMSFHVEYEKTRPSIDLCEQNIVHDLLVKSSEWGYEDEIRCLNVGASAGIYGYERQLLSSVILGARIGDHEDDIRRLVEETNLEYGTNVAVYKAALSESEYKIIIPDHINYST